MHYINGMTGPKICAVITENNFEVASEVDRFVDFYELRIDLIGDGWQDWAGRLRCPWIACNRLSEEGGGWKGDEANRIAKLFEAIKIGAEIVDVELRTPDLSHVVNEIKERRVRCLISSHDFKGTPVLVDIRSIIRQEFTAGADICKVVTTAGSVEDNITLLKIFEECKDVKLVAFAMGPLGLASRILSPMIGGYFTYASIASGKESASGQLTAVYLRSLYESVKNSLEQGAKS